mgnify:CR=1 FL=1
MAIKISPTYGAKSEKAIESLIAFGFDSKEARSILSACRDANDCLERIARAKVYLHGQQAPLKRNVLEFLRTSLFEDSEAIRENKFYSPTETKKLPDTEEFFKEQIKPYEERIKKLEESDKKKDVEITLLKAAIEHMKAEIEKLKAQLEKNKLIPPSKGGAKRPITSKK